MIMVRNLRLPVQDVVKSLYRSMVTLPGPCAEIRSQRSLSSTHSLPRPSPAPQSQNVTIDDPNLISAPRTNLNSVFASNLVQLKQKIKIVKRIPKGTRFLLASRLSEVIGTCLVDNASHSWHSLLLFPYAYLDITEKKEGVSLVQLIKDNLKSNSVCPSSKPKKFKIVSLETRVERKISDHDIRGAVKIISSCDTLAEFNDENLNELKKKHPSPSRLLNFPPAPDDSTMPLQTNSVAVLKSIESFPSGSSGGLDSLSPQHLKDLTSISAGDAGVKLLSSITKLCNFLLAGKLIEDIRPLFFGASLCALTKMVA